MATKAVVKREDGTEIPCLFNPSEFSITKANTWQPPDTKGKNTSQLKFQQGQPATMSLNLTLDTTKDGSSVTVHTKKLLELLAVTRKSGTNDNSNRPPWCQFVWGKKFVSFKAVVENLQLKYTYFNQDGVPLRAQATLSLKQFDDKDKWPQNPTSGTPHPHSVRQLLPGETLDRIAADVYGDAGQWRLIADANSILDPINLPVGASLIIPTMGVSRRG